MIGAAAPWEARTKLVATVEPPIVPPALEDLHTAVTDGALGVIHGVKTCFPRAVRQRCLVHRRGIASNAPRGLDGRPGCLTFLSQVARRYRGRELHIILDNSSTHSTPAVQAWLATHPLVHFHFTPKGASWLNMVEAWFSILTRKSVRRGSFDTVHALVRHIGRYIEEWNSHSTPFVWTKEPADIIKKAGRRAR